MLLTRRLRSRIGLALAIGVTSGCPDTSMKDAEALAAAGKLEPAAQRYLAIARKDPANLAAWDQAVELSCRQRVHVGDCLSILDLELELLGNVSRHHEALSEVLERRARQRLSKGMIQPALGDLERAEKAGPGRASVFVVKAKVYNAIGERDRAIAAIEQARKLDPNNEEANAVAKKLPAPPPPPPVEEGFGGTSTTSAAPR